VARIGCSYVIVAVGLITLGFMCVMSGRQLAPQDNEDARVFRTDPSCSAVLTSVTSSGACSVVDATIEVAGMRRGGGLTRTPSYTPYVYVRFADGTTQHDDLEGSAGDVFAESVRPGARARVQLFHGTMARLVSGSDHAETISAPDVAAETASELPWVGAVLIVIAALFVFFGFRAGRRRA
jgi:hypothetical protein